MTLMRTLTAAAGLSMLASVATNQYQIGQSFVGSGTWSDEDWSRPNVTGWLILAAMVGSNSSLLDHISDKINEEDSESYTLYHGTDANTAAYLAAGGDIDAGAISANRQWSASSGGFYLADHPDDAFWFGMASHVDVGFSVVEYTMTPVAYRTILSVSRVGPIPPAPNFWPQGNEIVVPVSAFPSFNSLKNKGEIIPGLSSF